MSLSIPMSLMDLFYRAIVKERLLSTEKNFIALNSSIRWQFRLKKAISILFVQGESTLWRCFLIPQCFYRFVVFTD